MRRIARTVPGWAGAAALGVTSLLVATTGTLVQSAEQAPTDQPQTASAQVDSADTATDTDTADADVAPATDYVGQVEVVREVGARADDDVLRGTVFMDDDRNSRFARDEDGVAEVVVSNGRDVVRTDENGEYELPAYDGMTVFITKPAGHDVPVDADGMAQFHYHHLPAGSPELRFGGLDPTGPLPSAVNFPIAVSETETGDQLRCAFLGDVQTYSNREIGFARDGGIGDIAARDDIDGCGALLLGDVAGDDLGIYPRIKTMLSAMDVPIRMVPGNHDIDFDSTDPEHSFDTFKQEVGPEYYSYDIGNVHVVGLNNVRYPCTPEDDNADGSRPHCNNPETSPTYNGVIGEEQLAWLAEDLEQTDPDKLVVIATHIPMVSFVDSTSTQHQTDDVTELYALLEGRPAVALSGHTHSLETLETGDSYAGWQNAVGVDELPFPHVVSGAISGDWYSGDLDINGIPMGLQRDGTVPGYLTFDFDGSEFQHTFNGVNRDEDEQMALGLNSPTWRDWYETLQEWRTSDEAGGRTPPPVNVNDLGDQHLLTTDDITQDTFLTVNLWNGSTSSEVEVQIGDRDPVTAVRTQQAQGEGVRSGALWADPYAATRQLQVARHAFESTSGDERAQGYELYRGSSFGPGPAQPGRNIASLSPHLWRTPVPANLGVGVHTATVTATDTYGREYTESMTFEVVEERPEMGFRIDEFAEPDADDEAADGGDADDEAPRNRDRDRPKPTR